VYFKAAPKTAEGGSTASLGCDYIHIYSKLYAPKNRGRREPPAASTSRMSDGRDGSETSRRRIPPTAAGAPDGLGLADGGRGGASRSSMVSEEPGKPSVAKEIPSRAPVCAELAMGM
jgi:hypothetical protein